MNKNRLSQQVSVGFFISHSDDTVKRHNIGGVFFCAFYMDNYGVVIWSVIELTVSLVAHGKVMYLP